MEIDKEALLFEFEARLSQWNTAIQGLGHRRRSDDQQKSMLSQRIESLVQRRNTLDNKIEKLRRCSSPAWREVVREVADAVEEVEEAWTCVASVLSRRDGGGAELAAGPSAPVTADVN